MMMPRVNLPSLNFVSIPTHLALNAQTIGRTPFERKGLIFLQTSTLTFKFCDSFEFSENFFSVK